MEMFVLRLPSGRYFNKAGGIGVLRPEDGRQFLFADLAQKVADQHEGSEVWRTSEAPQPEMWWVADKSGGFATTVRGGFARRGDAVYFGRLDEADRYTQPEIDRIKGRHPDAYVVESEEEARSIERARQAKEGMWEQWGSAHGF